MVKTRRRRNERTPVKLINDEWVENHCTNVTERDLNILRLLKRFPLLNSEQIMLLTKAGGGERPFHALSQGQKRCNERLRILYDLHCINKWSPRLAIGEGTSKQYVALDRAGCKLLGIERRIRQEIPQDWRHRSLIMDVYIEMVLKERSGECVNHFLQVENKQTTFPLIPDLTAVLQHQQKGVALFIEVDRSEKKEAAEKQKLRQYRDWQLSRAWANEAWVNSLPRPIFPIVLYLFDESKKGWQRRAGILEKEAQRLGLNAAFLGITKFASFLEMHLKTNQSESP